MNKKPKLNFDKLSNNPIFSHFRENLLGSITIIREELKDIIGQKLKGQKEYLENLQSQLETPKKVFEEFEYHLKSNNINITIPDKFVEFVSSNIKNLNETYSSALYSINDDKKRDHFVENLSNHLILAKKWLKDPNVYSDKIVGPSELIWTNNVSEKKNRDKSTKVFYPVDAMNQMFMARIYLNYPNLQDQLVNQLLIPHRLEQQKYSLNLAYQNAKSDIGFTKNFIEYAGAFLASLARNPRGLGNTSLPNWGNSFHNPGNHSTGVLALAMWKHNDAFSTVISEEKNSINIEHLTKVDSAYKLRKAIKAVTHDGGEESYREALVQGEVKKIKDRNLQEQLKETRDHFEDWAIVEKTIPKISAYMSKNFGMSERDIKDCENLFKNSLKNLNKFEKLEAEIVEKMHTSEDLIRLRKVGYEESAREILLKFSYTANLLYGTKIDLPDNFDSKRPYKDQIKDIEDILSKAKGDYKKSLRGQIKISEGSNSLETKALRKLYETNTDELEKEFYHYTKKLGETFGVSEKAVGQFIKNMEEINKEHLKSKRVIGN